MKKTALLLAALFAATGAFGDDKSDAILGALQKKVAGWGDYRVEFSVSIDGQSLAGSYEVSGESYMLKTPDILLYCDGETKWEVNQTTEEVVIDAVDPDDRTVLGNPTRLFDFLDGSYTHRYLGVALIGGISCERIELQENGTTNSATKEGQKIEVYISAATGLPVRLGYRIGLLSTDAVIDVANITPHITIDCSEFTFDPKRWAGFEVIDFR